MAQTPRWTARLEPEVLFMLRKMAHDLRLSQSDVVRLALYRLYDPFQKGQVKPTDRDVEMLRVG